MARFKLKDKQWLLSYYTKFYYCMRFCNVCVSLSVATYLGLLLQEDEFSLVQKHYANQRIYSYKQAK